jgi:hypothetical protein
MVYQLVSSDGKGTGTVNLNQNAAADYYIRPDDDQIFKLKRMNVWQVDANFNAATGYGAGSALTNGISITVENAEKVIINFTPVSIKTSFEWALLAGVDIPVIGGAGADALPVRWTFSKGGGEITLDGTKGEFLRVSFGDAMDFMDHFRIMVQGTKNK